MRTLIKLLALGLFMIGLWFYGRGCTKRVDSSIRSTTLAPGVAEKLIVNPANHTLVVVRPSGGSQTLFLPDRPSSIEIGDKGAVKVTVQQMGTEMSPGIGFAYSDQARLALGVSLAYWRKWEVGIYGYPSITGRFSFRFGPVLSWNMYQNTSLFAGVTNTLAPIGGLALKF